MSYRLAGHSFLPLLEIVMETTATTEPMKVKSAANQYRKQTSRRKLLLFGLAITMLISALAGIIDFIFVYSYVGCQL